MSHLHERPEGANDADPPRSRPPWKASNPSRRSMLGLADVVQTGSEMPEDAKVIDALAHGLLAAYVDDPVEALVESVRIELEGLASAIDVNPIGRTLDLLARRLATAIKLLRWCDNRDKMPVDEPPEEEEETDEASADAEVSRAPEPETARPAADASDEDDLEKTRDAAPEGPRGDA